MNAVRLENLAWPELAELRERHGGLLMLPLGATEQHGPHLPVSMDTLLAEAVCDAVSARTGVPVMSALRYTVSQGHTAKWPGTFSLRHSTFLAVLRDLAEWANATGWKRLLLVNAHFGNDAPARVAVDQLRIHFGGSVHVGLCNVYQLTESIWKTYTEDAADLHANRAETSLMLHLHPDLVHADRLATADDLDRTTGLVFSHPVSRTSLNGVTGEPSKADAAEGAALFEEMTDALAEIVNQAATEEPPLAADHWKHVPIPSVF